MSQKRQLAAIVFTDISNFTSLMAKDENEALKLLDKQDEILTPIIKEFHGTINNRIGDGLLITFPTVTDAVKCGIKIQKETKQIESLNLRIGIHEGEITLKDGDVLGDDVNVASRIESFAAEGGIVISGKVQQNISSLPEFETKFISEPSLKGVRQSVKVFCIISHGLPETDITKVTAKLEKDVKKLGLNQRSIIGVVTILSVITLILGILFFSKEDTNNIVETIPDDMISIYFPTIISNQFGSKEETTSILAPLVETFVAMELGSTSSFDNINITDNMDNIIFSQINSNWIDSIYSDILIELTSKYFQKHKLFAMDDIENKLAKKGAMIDFNQPPIIEKADGNMQEVMSLLGSALNDDVRIIAIKDIMEVGISTIQLIYIYGMNPTLDGNDIFIIYEEFEASTDEDSNWSFTGGLNVALSKSQDLVDDIIAEIEEDINSILFSKFPSTVISQNGPEVLIKTNSLAKPKKYSTFTLEREYDCTDSIKFHESRLRHLETYFSLCDTTQNLELIEQCRTLINNEAGFYVFSKDEHNDLLNNKHQWCLNADNFSLTLGIQLIVKEVYDSTAIGTLKDWYPGLHLEKGDKLVIQ